MLSGKDGVDLAYGYETHDTRLGYGCSERNKKIIGLLFGAGGCIGDAGLRHRQRACPRSI